ncbi:MAG: hypothetical protein OWT28_03285 [Firmicutes bacterium]|nr:hypothetical protein [Bacillota bacterium]
MSVQAVVWILVAIVAGLFWWRGRKAVRPAKASGEVVQALEAFSREMEEENERLIEMLSLLRQKIDGLEIEQRQAGEYLRQQTNDLSARASRLETQMNQIGHGGQSLAVPGYLSARYRTVAERLLAGHPREAVMKELDLGQAEVDLVARLLESDQSLPL